MSRYLKSEKAVLRARITPWVAVGVMVLFAGLAVYQPVEQGPLALITSNSPLYLVMYLLWWYLVQPHVVVREHSITVANPVKTHRLQFADLVDVETRFGLTLRTRHRKIQAVGLPGGGFGGATFARRDDFVNLPDITYRGSARNAAFGDLRNTASGRAAEIIRGHWQDQVETGTLQGTESEPTSTWNTIQLAVLGLFAAMTVLWMLA